MNKVIYAGLILATLYCILLAGCGSTSSITSNTTPAHAGRPHSPETRAQIVIISDLHLGADDISSQMVHNRSALVDFLDQIRTSGDVKELVIDGDLLDEWALPLDYVIPRSQSAFVDAIAANNKTVIAAFNKIIEEGNIKVTCIPGNHDMLVGGSDLQRIFPGINLSGDEIRGLGVYLTGVQGEIAIEHGHRYDFYCSPDPVSNRDITRDNTSILPPAYFFSRLHATSNVEGHPAAINPLPQLPAGEAANSQSGYYLYARAWSQVLSNFPVKETFSEKVIKTRIDGYMEDYAINDLVPRPDPGTGRLEVNLYRGIQDNWGKRQEINGVPVKIPLQDAMVKASDPAFLDSQAGTQYFERDPSRRIVVFGHTHAAKLEPCTNLEGRKTIYANAGAWIDNGQGYPTLTYVVITLPGAASAVESVSLFQYCENKTSALLADTQFITIR